MDADIEHMVTSYVQSTDSVVEAQGQIDAGSSLDCLPVIWWKQGIANVPYCRIFGDRFYIVKDEGAVEAVVIGQQASRNDHNCRRQDLQTLKSTPGLLCPWGGFILLGWEFADFSRHRRTLNSDVALLAQGYHISMRW